MKKTFVKINSKKFIPAAALIALLSLSAVQVSASDIVDKPAVEYAGIANNSASFDIKYENESGEDFRVVIKNESGDIIYSKTYNNKNFSKKFIIDQLPDDGAKVTFIITAAHSNYKQSFAIVPTRKETNSLVVVESK